MIVRREFHNIGCDCCGRLLDEDTWWDGEDCPAGLLEECGWKALGEWHYCDECWSRDDDDTIVTGNGRRFGDDGQEITED